MGDVGLGMEEYARMQQELIALKEFKYEAQDKEKMLNQELQRLKKLTTTQDKEIAKLKKDLEKATSIVTKSKEKTAFAALSDQHELLNQKFEDVRRQSQTLQTKLDAATKLTETQQEELEKMKANLASCVAERNLLASGITTNGEAGADDSQSDSVRVQTAQLIQRASNSEQETQRLKNELSTLSTTLSTTTALLKQKQDLLDQVQEMQASQDKEAREAVEFLQREIETLKRENETLKQQVAKRGEESAQQSALTKDFDAVKQNEKSLQDANSKLERQKIVLEEQVSTLSNELAYTRDLLQTAQNENQALTTKAQQLDSQLEDTTEKLRVQTNNGALHDVVRQLQRDLDAKVVGAEESRREIETLKKELEAKKMTVAQQTSEAQKKASTAIAIQKDLEQICTRKDSEIESLKKNVAALKEFQDQNNALKEEMQKLSATIEQLKQQIATAENQNKDLSQAKKQLEDQANEAELFSKRQAQTIKDLRGELRRVAGEVESANTSRDQAVSDLERAKASIKALDAKLEEARSSHFRLRAAPAPQHTSEVGVDAKVLLDKLTETQSLNIQLSEKTIMLENQVQRLTRDLESKDAIVREMLRKGQTMITRQDEDDMSDTNSTKSDPHTTTTSSQQFNHYNHNNNNHNNNSSTQGMFRNASSKLKTFKPKVPPMLANTIHSLTATQASALAEDKERTMEALMEDLLLKNIDLQKALDTLGKEMGKVQAENTKLKRQQNDLKLKLMGS